MNVANLSVMTSFIFSLLSPSYSDKGTKAQLVRHVWRGRPARSFSFISTVKFAHSGEVAESPGQIRLPIEIRYDLEATLAMHQSDSAIECRTERCEVDDKRLELEEMKNDDK